MKSAERVASPSQVKTQGWEAMTWWLRHQAAPSGTRGAGCPGERPASGREKGQEEEQVDGEIDPRRRRRVRRAPRPRRPRAAPAWCRPRPAPRAPGRAQKLSGPRWQVNETSGPKGYHQRGGARPPGARRGKVARSHRQTSATESSDSAPASHCPPTPTGQGGAEVVPRGVVPEVGLPVEKGEPAARADVLDQFQVPPRVEAGELRQREVRNARQGPEHEGEGQRAQRRLSPSLHALPYSRAGTPDPAATILRSTRRRGRRPAPRPPR